MSVGAPAAAAAVMRLLAPALDPAAQPGPHGEGAPLIEVSPVLTVRASSGPVPTT